MVINYFFVYKKVVMILDKKQFEVIASNSGYCTLKFARKYIEDSGKGEFTEKDLEEVWRMHEAKKSNAFATSANNARRLTYYSNGHNSGRRSKRYKQSERMGSPNND
jgi:hypothetical protein